ncbi:MAG: MFS transporter [Promethearchaeota archaeon]
MPEAISELTLRKIKRNNLIVLYIINFIHGICIGAYNSVYQAHLLDITKSEFLVGVVQSTGFFLMLLSMLVSGKLSERYGRKKMILFGTIMFIAGFAVLYFGRTLPFLIIGSMLAYGGFGFLDPSWVASIAENTNEKNSGLVYGLTFFFFFFGSIIGSLLVSLLESNPTVEIIGLGSNAAFYFLIGIGILFLEGLIQMVFLNEKAVFQRKSHEHIKKQKKIWRVYFHDKALRRLLIFFVLDAFVWGNAIQLYYTSLLSVDKGFGITQGQLALYVVLVVNVANLVFQIPAGKLIDKIGSKKGFLISEYFGLLFLILNIVTWFLPRDYLILMLILSQIAWGLMIVPWLPAQNKIISRVYPERTAEIYGFMNFARNIFWFGAGYLAGWNLGTFGFLGPMIVGVVGVVVEIVYIYAFIDEKKLLNLTVAV